MFRITIAGIAYVDFTQGAVIACAVVLTFGYTTADGHVYVVTVLFVHKIKTSF
jgi:hypothetical protein